MHMRLQALRLLRKECKCGRWYITDGENHKCEECAKLFLAFSHKNNQDSCDPLFIEYVIEQITS